MTQDMAGRVGIVTGASSGIGEATAHALAAAGMAVTVAARRRERIEALVGGIESAGGRALAVEADVTDEEQVRDLVARTVERFGRLDTLVNNAGVMLLGPIVDADVEDWRRMLSLNVLGLMYATHAALPHLLTAAEESGVADVVNVSSVAGRVARLGSGVYNASKWAVNAFAESLRQEVTERGVRVSLVEPGAVATELTDHITHAQSKENTRSWVSSVTPLQSEDIARAVAYIVGQPAHVAVNEILVRPTAQAR